MSRLSYCLLIVCVSCMPAIAFGQEIPAPLAYWDFDDNVVDQSGNGNDGTLMGAAGYDADVPAAIGSGSSLSLSGDGSKTDYVDLNAHAANFAGLGEGTISGWFKTAGAGVDTILAASHSSDGSSELRVILEGGRAWLDVREQDGGDFVGAALFSRSGVYDDSWHHVGITVDGSSNARMYIDGEFVSSTREPFFSAVNDIDVLGDNRTLQGCTGAAISAALAETGSGAINAIVGYENEAQASTAMELMAEEGFQLDGLTLEKVAVVQERSLLRLKLPANVDQVATAFETLRLP